MPAFGCRDAARPSHPLSNNPHSLECGETTSLEKGGHRFGNPPSREQRALGRRRVPVVAGHEQPIVNSNPLAGVERGVLRWLCMGDVIDAKQAPCVYLGPEPTAHLRCDSGTDAFGPVRGIVGTPRRRHVGITRTRSGNEGLTRRSVRRCGLAHHGDVQRRATSFAVEQQHRFSHW